jgi:hypothetical protein
MCSRSAFVYVWKDKCFKKINVFHQRQNINAFLSLKTINSFNANKDVLKRWPFNG